MNPGLKTLGRPLSRLLIASSVIAAFPAHADDKAEIEKLKAQIQELDQKLRILDRKQEIATEEAAAKQKSAPVVNASDKGFGFKSADGQFELKFRGITQVDYRSFSGTAYPAAVDGFLARRIRPTLEGTVFGKYGFRFTPEFGESGDGKSNSAPEQNKTRVIDAYLDARFDPSAQLRFGKFKPFVGLERLQAAADTKFIERSYVSNNILPNRDFGVSLFGDVLDKKLNYAVGVFNGVTDGADNSTAQDLNSQKEYTARVFATPFVGNDSAWDGLGFGLAVTYGTSNGTETKTSSGTVTAINSNLPSYKTPGQANTFFSYLSKVDTVTAANNNYVIADGVRARFTPQAHYYNGPLGVLAEYAQVRQGVTLHTGAAGTAGTHSTLTNSAWHVSTSWLLTGESASFKGVKPFSPFKAGPEGGWGAFELLARYQQIQIDDAAFSNGFVDTGKENARTASTWGIGLNWYLNEASKFAFNYDTTRFGGGTGSKKLDGKSEDLFIARYQLAF